MDLGEQVSAGYTQKGRVGRQAARPTPLKGGAWRTELRNATERRAPEAKKSAPEES